MFKHVSLSIVIISLFSLFVSLSFAKEGEVVFTTIPPIKYIIDRIVNETDIKTENIVERGRDPHNFELTPSLIKKIEKSRIYFSVGLGGSEEEFIKKLKNTYPTLKIIDISQGIDKIKINLHEHDEDKHQGHNLPYDPHVWNSPKNMKIIAKNIYESLANYYPDHKKTFYKNYTNLVKDLEKLDKEVLKILAPYKGKKFLVFHSAFRYFERDYGVKEISIEYEGKEASPKLIKKIIETVNKENIKVIFVQSGFSTKSANVISESTGAKIKEINPIDYDYINNIKYIAQMIGESYK